MRKPPHFVVFVLGFITAVIGIAHGWIFGHFVEGPLLSVVGISFMAYGAEIHKTVIKMFTLK